MELKVLLINPPSRALAYDRHGRAGIARVHPSLGLASLAARVRGQIPVRILDLNVETYPEHSLQDALTSFAPTHVGVTATTPQVPDALKVLQNVKKIAPACITIVGGPHASALPDEVAADVNIDLAVIGEGEETFAELLVKPPAEVAGVCFKEGGKTVHTQPRPLIENLDALPLPAWDLYDLKRYRAPVAVERHPPGGLMETSRGCPHDCTFCSKVPFGKRYRVKSVSRVVEEFKYMERAGFREIHVEDDGFSEDIARAKEICSALAASSIRIPWNLLNGVRVDRFDSELAHLLAKAGCYQCGFGIETGGNAALNAIGKCTTSDMAQEAVTTAKEAGLETIGYFVIGLPGDTESSLHETLDLACNLPLDYAKFSLFVPYPGSKAFDELNGAGRILTRDWSVYLYHDLEHEVFRHESLSKAVLAGFYRKAYRRFYLRLPYMFRRLADGLRKGTLLRMLRDFTLTRW
jgi:radical SAM superfamily enzyme YgiQ (UPF0313 family)